MYARIDTLQAGFDTVIYVEDATLSNDKCFSADWQRTTGTIEKPLPDDYKYKASGGI